MERLLLRLMNKGWNNARFFLPPNNGCGISDDYLTVNTHGGYDVLAYHFDKQEWTTGIGVVRNIAYWRKLPDYPKNL